MQEQFSQASNDAIYTYCLSLVTLEQYLLLFLLLVVESHHCLLGLSIHRLQQDIDLVLLTIVEKQWIGQMMEHLNNTHQQEKTTVVSPLPSPIPFWQSTNFYIHTSEQHSIA